MSELMRALHTDHAHLNRLLQVLEGQTRALRRGEDPDWDRIIDILDYMIQYPDAIHHPREERLFEKALERAGESGVAETIHKLSAEHETLPKRTLALRKLVDDVRDDAAILTREEVSERIEDYIRRQRQHIVTEETSLFPLIENLLAPEDWEALQSVPVEIHDPVFGPVASEQFARLIEELSSEQDP